MKKLVKKPSDSASIALEQFDTDREKIEATLQKYETALKASDADTVTTLFTPDGVFMPQHGPSTIGTDAIRAAYGFIFQTITFDVELQLEEIVRVAPDWAFVRTSSAGFVSVHAIGERVPDANHELFILERGGDDEWRIARYCFSTTKPPRQ